MISTSIKARTIWYLWGALRKMYLGNLFILSWFGNNFFILSWVKNKLFFFVPTRHETIFISAYNRKPTGHAVSFHDNMSNSIGSESSDVYWLEWTYCMTRNITILVPIVPQNIKSPPSPHMMFGLKKDIRGVMEKTYYTSMKWHACGGETICQIDNLRLCLSIHINSDPSQLVS